MFIAPPPAIDYGFYNGYVTKAPRIDLIIALKENRKAFSTFINTLTEEDLLRRYQPDKWNVKEVLVHLIDAERNFCYRAMRISRGDQTPLPTFDVHSFVMNSHATEREMKSILHELDIVRESTIAMYDGMHPDMLDKTGPARDVTISVRALGFAIVGHVMHHEEIIRSRYLVSGRNQTTYF